ncbi:MAG TPA: hypothetical protein VGF79_12220 [Bacteroidia bacterium]
MNKIITSLILFCVFCGCNTPQKEIIRHYSSRDSVINKIFHTFDFNEKIKKWQKVSLGEKMNVLIADSFDLNHDSIVFVEKRFFRPDHLSCVIIRSFDVGIDSNDSVYLLNWPSGNTNLNTDLRLYFKEITEQRQRGGGLRVHNVFRLHESESIYMAFMVNIARQLNKNTSQNWDTLANIVIAMHQEVNVYRDQVSIEIYGRKFANLNSKEKMAIYDLVPLRILLLFDLPQSYFPPKMPLP